MILNSIIVIAIIAAVFAVLIWQKKAERAQATQSLIDLSVCKYSERTPKGALLRSANVVNSEAIAAIDLWLTQLFAKAKKRGWTNKVTHPEQLIYIVPPERELNSAGEYVPNFLIRGDNYDGSDFDQDARPGVGMVLAAEYVLPDVSGFVLPEYTRDFEKFGDIAAHGALHVLAFHNDRAFFERTKTHGNAETDAEFHQFLYGD